VAFTHPELITHPKLFSLLFWGCGVVVVVAPSIAEFWHHNLSEGLTLHKIALPYKLKGLKDGRP
jgi:hypothetical protein